MYTVFLCSLNLGPNTIALVEPAYYGHLDFPHGKAAFGTTTKCADYTGVLIFKCPY